MYCVVHSLVACLALLPFALANSLHHLRDLSSADYNGIIHKRQGYSRAPMCVDDAIHIIAGSGAGAPQQKGYGLLNTTVAALRAQFPGATNFSIPFNKTNNTAYIAAAVAQGVELLTANLEWYAGGCPNTPVVLLGYSEGGIVVMNTLCGRSVAGSTPYGTPLDSKWNTSILATVLYGEETRSAEMPWNAGTCVNGSGLNPRQNNAGCAAFSSGIQSYCDVNDPRCCVGGPDPNLNIHFVYPSEYDSTATQYVAAKYAAKKSGSTTTSTTSTIPTPTTTASSSSTTTTSTTSSVPSKPTPSPSCPWPFFPPFCPGTKGPRSPAP